MKTIELKTEIHELIEKVNDIQLLNAIKILLTREKDSDWWENLSDREKQALEKGLQESETGNLIPHNVVMEEIIQKYSSK